MKRVGNKKIFSKRISSNVLDVIARGEEVVDKNTAFGQPTAAARFLSARIPEVEQTSSIFAVDDFYFEVTTPFAIKNNPIDDTLRNISKASKFEITSNFNFFNKDYDNLKTSYDESDLLNYYILISRDITNNKKIEDIVTLNGSIDDALLNSREGSKEYFSKYASVYPSKPISDEDKNKLKYIVVDSKYSHLDTSGKKDLFTDYIQMDLHKESAGDFIETIGMAKFDNRYMSKVSDFGIATVPPSLGFSVVTQEITNIDLNQPTVTEATTTENIRYFNYIEWLNNTVQDIESPNYFDFSSGNAFFVGSPADFDDLSSNNEFYTKLMSTVLSKKTTDLSRKHLRSVEDIRSGKKCYSEITAVKIEKRLASDTGVLLQEYFFENDSKDLLTFIDTQVKKDNEYVYKLFYYVLVVGNEIAVEAKNPNSVKDIKYKNLPKIYVFEIEATQNSLDNRVTQVSEISPVSPIVTPIAYKDVKNKIRFNFQQSVDKYEELPVIIQDSDINIFDNLRKSQNKETDSKILFETVNTDGLNFEIFRTIYAPLSYADFKNKQLTTISNTSYIDKLEVNRKYYYTFRTKSQSGLISNPTPVYEIQLLENSGAHYPIIRLYKFPEDIQTTAVKNFKKQVYLSAAYNQLLANEVGASATTNPSLGVGEPIWNKNYKIRLTSKQTGRKIDINFTFTYGIKEE